MKNLYLFFLVFFCSTIIKAQGWEKLYPITSSSSYHINDMLVLDDERFVLLNWESKTIFGPDTTIITMTDQKGNIQWETKFSISDESNRGATMVRTTSGGFLVAGNFYTPNPQHKFNIFILKLDSLGNEKWRKTFDYGFDQGVSDIIRKDDHYFLAGSVEDSTGNTDILLMKINSNGDIIWQKNYGTQEFEWANCIIATNDGGLAMAGSRSGAYTGFILKTDADGNIEWQKSYPDEIRVVEDFIQTYDGGYVLVGNEASALNFGVLRTNALGEVLWTTGIGGPFDGRAYGVVQNNHGNILVTGYYKDGDIGNVTGHMLLAELDKTGAFVWKREYGQEFAGGGKELVNLPDYDGYGLAGRVGPGNNIFLAKTDLEGNTFPNLLIGNVYHDIDDDCTQDNEDIGLEGWYLEVTGSMLRSAVTGEWGDYIFNLDTGNYQLHIYPPSPYWFPCPASYSFSFPENFDTVVMNVPVKSVIECPMMEVSVSAFSLRRCFDNYYHVQYCNNGTVPADNAYVQVTFDSQLLFIDSSIPAVQTGAYSYSFDLGTVNAGDCGSFYIVLMPDCDAVLGTEQCIEAHIFPDTVCMSEIPYYPVANECRPVTGSFDPNDKRCFVNGRLEENYVQPNKSLEYQIRFQNTGNDTAFQVVIRDTISELLDIFSISPGASSHPYKFEMYGERILKFTFENIMLPDSNINEPASHGFVKFRIEQKPDLPNGTFIKNNAGIYFDFNAPVITNTHTLVVRGPNTVLNLDKKIMNPLKTIRKSVHKST